MKARRGFVGLALIAASGLGCSDLLVEPVQAPRAVLTVTHAAADQATAAALADVFDRVDQIVVRVRESDGGAELWNGPVGFVHGPLGAVLDPLDLDYGEEAEEVDVEVTLHVGAAEVFRGEAEVALDDDESDGSSSISVDPVPDHVVIDPIPPIEAIGQIVEASGGVRFATGDPIPGVALVWSSANPEVVAVDAESGQLTALREGEATVTATTGVLATAAAVSVKAVVEQVLVGPAELELDLGDVANLAAVVVGAGGATLDRAVSWTSSNPAVASVDGTGHIEARAPGSATVTAMVEGVAGESQISVLAPQGGAVTRAATAITPTSARLEGSVSAQSQAVAVWFEWGTGPEPEGMSPTASQASPTAPGDFTADLSGLLPDQRYFFRAALATLADTVFGQVRSFQTSTGQAVSSVVLVAPTAAYVTEVLSLSFIALDDSGNPATPNAVMWTSSDTTVATVDAAGTLVAVGPGSASIGLDVDGVVDQSTLMVTVAPLAQVTLSPPTATINLGDSVQFTATATDALGAVVDTAFSWSSSAPAVASLDASGRVAALAVGSTQIRAAVGAVEATATVTVTDPVAQVLLTPSDTTAMVGDTVVYQAVALNAVGDTLSVPFTWSSSDGSVATIDAQGWAVAGSVGTTTIGVQAESLSASTSLTVDPAGPSVKTKSANNVDETEARLRASFAGQSPGADGWFEYGLASDLSDAVTTPEASLFPILGAGTFNRTVTGLSADTRYYHRAVVRTASGDVIYGEIRNFRTDDD
ncbi:MAG: hypothetical protein HKN71_07580 [Gemmatimonadetes bacterium]|nr:hypothetical protein [Gemmatimonadota bacterium]